ncbi:DUF1642 domain-containing protein [Streptococcus mitis]|uniref:DUF1642 domain-containing protein n=1 Tax=Streptococcus mitis TaxID=28037 RepID=UPI0020480782|nr:DUF1642 domain-containing protein [Streptococcus mitis]MDK6637352.1 DUF1642 domain-containing protein [Streptococcus mitis]MDK7133911.1 DUF1642 domain-containing protein [Streptococcus mitis]DAN36562.1 MAG TPA: Protein of unknown function (DUF1642) [Caudoviricetes sp.]
MKIGDNVVLHGTIKGVTYGEYGFPHYLVTLPNGCETELPKPYIEDLQQLDEPKLVKVPQFVAEWIEEKRDMGWKLAQMLLQAGLNEQYGRWVVDNQDLFARAWLDGYEVEKEKRYLVKIKGDIKENTLVYGELLERYFFTKGFTLGNAIYYHTRKELEEAGFGWVFDCPGIEIEEVE